jgi:hypothetical protein
MEHNVHLIGRTVEYWGTTWQGVTVCGKHIHCNKTSQDDTMKHHNTVVLIAMKYCMDIKKQKKNIFISPKFVHQHRRF